MANYIVTYTGANGVKAYAAGLNAAFAKYTDSFICKFSFAKDEALVYTKESADSDIEWRVTQESFFLHDSSAATLPAGLDWQAEKI